MSKAKLTFFAIFNVAVACLSAQVAPADLHALGVVDSSLLLSYTAPNANPCSIVVSSNADYSSPSVNLSDGGGGLPRQVLASGLTPNVRYYFNATCGSEVGAGAITTAPSRGTITVLPVMLTPPAGTDQVVMEYGSSPSLGTVLPPVACSSGCTVNIPLSGNAVYYKWSYFAAGAFRSTSGTYAATAPGNPVPTQVLTCGTGQVTDSNAASANPQPLATNSSYAANSFSSDWLNSPGTIITNNYWTTANTNYMLASNNANFVLQSTRCSRDMEVDTWTLNGYVILRLSPMGTGIYFYLQDQTVNGQLDIGIITGAGQGSYLQGNRYTLYTNTDLAHTVPGFRKTQTDSDHFTFGVDGFDIYAKFNGVEFARFKDYRAMDAGTAALKADAGYGFRNTTVRHNPPRPLWSDYQENILDLRDFGISSLQATGSIAANSTQMVLSSIGTTGFNPGDGVIVEVGGEAGQGLRGSQGVGGTWPQLSYVDFTHMSADTSQLANTFAWLQTNGAVYQFVGGAWQPRDPTQYYTNTVYPLALIAKVVAVSNDGLTLTLDTPASVASVNANVYFDNTGILQTRLSDALQNGQSNNLAQLTPQGVRLVFPAGNFAISGPVVIDSLTCWKILGQGPSYTKIFSPKGAVSTGFLFQSSPSSEIHNLQIQGNATDNGYGLSVTQTAVPQGLSYPNGVIFSQSDNSYASNLQVTNVFQGGIHSSFSNNVWADHISVSTQGLQDYVGWFIAWGDSVGGGCTDCNVISRYLVAGFSSFSSLNTQLVDCSGVNASAATNSAGGYLYKNMNLTIEAGSQLNENSFSKYNPVVNIDSNIGRQPYLPYGGTLENVTIAELGYINSSNDILTGIIVNSTTPNVNILGGSYSAPDYLAPSVLAGPQGLNSTGTNTVVNGFSVAGQTNPAGGVGNINMTSGMLSNCIANWIVVQPAVVVQNCTNAAQP